MISTSWTLTELRFSHSNHSMMRTPPAPLFRKQTDVIYTTHSLIYTHPGTLLIISKIFLLSLLLLNSFPEHIFSFFPPLFFMFLLYFLLFSSSSSPGSFSSSVSLPSSLAGFPISDLHITLNHHKVGLDSIISLVTHTIPLTINFYNTIQ